MLQYLEIQFTIVYILIFYFCQGLHSSTEIRQAYVVQCSSTIVGDVFVQKPSYSLGLLLMTIKQLFTLRDFIGPCPGECPIDPEFKIPKHFQRLSAETTGNLQSDAKVSWKKGSFLPGSLSLTLLTRKGWILKFQCTRKNVLKIVLTLLKENIDCFLSIVT